MRLPFILSLTLVLAGVMVGVTPLVKAGEYESAQALLSVQKWSEALPILKNLTEEEPDSVTIAKDLAQVLLRLNRREEALEILRRHKLVRQAEIAARSFLSKESFRFYQQGLDWFSKHNYTQACERLDRALEKDQGHLEILLRLAQCNVLDGNVDLALKLFDSLERVHGKTSETQLWRARSLALKGKHEEATALFSALSGVNIKGNDSITELVSLWWGEALLSSGQKTAALSVFENDAKKFPLRVQTALAAIKIRLSQAESPNQFLALQRDLNAWDHQLELRLNEKKNKTGDFSVDLLDAESIRRVALDLRLQLKLLLPSPLPSPSSHRTRQKTDIEG